MGYWWVNDGLMRHLRGYDGDLIGHLMGFKRIQWDLMVVFISFPWLWRPCIKTGCHTRFSLCSHQRDADEDCTTSLVRWHFLVLSGVGPKQNVRHVRSIASVANRHCTEPCGHLGLHRHCISAIDYSDANQGPRWTDDSPKSVVPKWGLHDRQFEERSGIAEPPGIYPINIP